jgi:hypothetical protein
LHSLKRRHIVLSLKLMTIYWASTLSPFYIKLFLVLVILGDEEYVGSKNKIKKLY